jgi:hypothetical protein
MESARLNALRAGFVALAGAAVIAVALFLWSSDRYGADAGTARGRADIEGAPDRAAAAPGAMPTIVGGEPLSGPVNAGASRQAVRITTIPLAVTDVANRPIAGARAILQDSDEIFVSDSHGVLDLPFDALGKEGAIVADEYEPGLFGLGNDPGNLGRVEMDPFRPCRIRFVREPGARPVARAPIERFARKSWEARALARLGVAPERTDADGWVFLQWGIFGSTIRDLVIHDPAAPDTTYLLGAAEIERENTNQNGAARFTFTNDTAATIRLEDSSGAALAGAAVTLRWDLGAGWIDRSARSDALGRVVLPFVDASDWISCRSLEVKLGENRRWFAPLSWSEKREAVVVVRFAPIHGRIDGATGRRFFVRMDCSTSSPPEAPSPRWRYYDTVTWTPVEPDGSFVIADGWQCEKATCVLLLDAESGSVVDVVFVDTANETRLREPDRCDLTCEVELAPGAAASETAVQFSRSGFYSSPQDSIPIYMAATIPKHLSLPRGKYYVLDVSGVRNGQALAEIDCSGPTAELRLTIERHFHIVGIVEGEMSGPCGDADIEFRDAHGRNVASVHTDARGAFDASVFGTPPIEIYAYWPIPNYHRQRIADPIARVTTAEAAIRFTRPEGKLVLNVVRAPVAADRTGVIVQWLDAATGEVLDDIFDWPGVDARVLETTVIPGRYRVRRAGFSDGTPTFQRELAIERGATARVDVAPAPIGILRVHVKYSSPFSNDAVLLANGVEAAKLDLRGGEPETVVEVYLPPASLSLRLKPSGFASPSDRLDDDEPNESRLTTFAALRDGEITDVWFEIR